MGDVMLNLLQITFSGLRQDASWMGVFKTCGCSKGTPAETTESTEGVVSELASRAR